MQYLSQLNKKELNGKICLLRLDLNIKSLTDTFKIDSAIPTIKFLLAQNAKIVILSHRGRPNGPEENLSLKPIIEILSQKIKNHIDFFSEFNFDSIKDRVLADKQHKIFSLENLRFLVEEEKDDAGLAKKIASLGDLYINDAFAVSHRFNASVSAITKYIKSFAGPLMEKEVSALNRATQKPKQPLIVILGGTKINDKIDIVQNLGTQAKFFLFGSSILNEMDNRKVKNILNNTKCILPKDYIKVEENYFDIGPKTIKYYTEIISKAKTIIWNGPVGMSEDAKYAKGTTGIAKAIVNSKAFKVVGGGETANFILKKKLAKKIDLLSTGGGAMLNFLTGKEMPGIEALKS